MDRGIPAPGQGTSLRGRARECAELDSLLEAVRAGEGRSIVLRGEAGIGKTALLHYLIEAASDLTVVRAVGVESEMELPFASLHQLCGPMLGRIGELPPPQRDALEIVFGLSVGPPPDRFLVGLAVLSLFSEVADERPLLCVVDDAQWLDQASALTLAFVARRLVAEPVAVVFAAREPGEQLQHLAKLDVRGLRHGDARALLGSAVRFMLDDPVRERLITETRGNPLALLELPRGLSAAQLAGGFGILGVDGLSGRIEQSYVRRIDTLREDERRLLLIAAAEPAGDPLLLWRAAGRLGVSSAAAAGVEAHDLLAIRERVTFRHPLVRSAVYRSASPEDRRAVHLALAEVTDQVADPDRRAWHLAAAAAGPDEAVARELEQSASRAQGRGGLAAAAAFLQRAVTLNGEPARRVERALAAAEASLGAGMIEAARGLMAAAGVGPLDELQHARLDLLRAQAAYAESRGSEAPALLLSSAKALQSLDPRLAHDTYLDAWSAALFAGRLAGAVSLHDVSREALAASRSVDDARPSELLLNGFALAFAKGRAAAAPFLERAARSFAAEGVAVEAVLRWGWLATAAAVMVWDHETCLQVSARGVDVAREAGALTVLAVSVNVMTQAVVLGGDFTTAASLVSEANAVTEATGTRVAPYGALVLGGLRGRAAEADRLIDEVIAEFTAGGQGTAVQYAYWARSLLRNGLGRHSEALAAAEEASDDTPELFVAVWATIELLEAAVKCGRPETAHRALERIIAATSVARTEWALGICARSRALLSEGDAAERLFREAIDRLARTTLRPELARSHLLFGEWLQHEGRRDAARDELRTAHERFTNIGMEAFADRARRALSATGERVPKRAVQTREALTAQEQQIAGLARDGLSNPEIGARLFLSPRTVEWHLRKVFTKLGISSRRELTSALQNPDPR